MKKFLGKTLKGKVASLHMGNNEDLSKPACASLLAQIGGFEGDKHHGPVRETWEGEWQPAGTTRRNERQWSAVSVEELAHIRDQSRFSEKIGVCFDTCHVFAAGYSLGTKKEYLKTIRDLDTAVGLEKVKCFHLNDSRREWGSRVDRHAHIGRGEMGLAPFRHLLRDRRFRQSPVS